MQAAPTGRRLLPALASFGFIALSAAVAAGTAFGCRSQTNAGNCSTHGEGCECATDGDTTECGETISYQPGADEATCRMGTRTCIGGKWGACVGSVTTFQSVPKARFKSATATECTSNPCSVGCMNFIDDGRDVDAGAGFVVDDAGGLSLTVQEAGTTTNWEGGTGCKPGELKCQIDPCSSSGGYLASKLTGAVYDPAGKNPIPNVLVYIPNGTVTAPADGLSCDACSTGTGDPIVSTITDYKGEFTLNGVPSGTNIPLVIKSGKWQRQLTIPSITACVTNTLTTGINPASAPLVRFPRNRSEGSIPRIAFVSGYSDPFQCVLSKMGIDVSASTSEVGVPFVGGAFNDDRIHYYQGTSNAGRNLSTMLGGGAPDANTLYGGLDVGAACTADSQCTTQQCTAGTCAGTPVLDRYDAVILSCEGAEYDKGATISARVADYAARGGRVFATHFSYAYLQFAPAASQWPQVVKFWNHTVHPADPLTTYINRTFAKGDQFARWLNHVNASPTLGELSIQEGRHDYDYVDPSRATPWMYADSSGSISGASSGGTCFSDGQCKSGNCVGDSTNLVANGGFEAGSLASWTATGEASASNTAARTATYSALLGVATTATRTADDYLEQTFTVPTGNTLLSFWYESDCNDFRDWFAATLKDNTAGTTTTIQSATCPFTTSWRQVTAPVVPGHSYTLMFREHNEDNLWLGNDGSWTFVDDVSLVVGGTCADKTCTADADCAGLGAGAACWGGTCVPGHDMEPLMTFNVPVGVPAASQCGRVVFSDFHVSANALSGFGDFPDSCATGDLSSQEKALEYMLFDLTSCLTPDYVPPGSPPYVAPLAVTRDYSATCPVGTRPEWHFFDWMTHTPGDSKIEFHAQTGDTAAQVAAMSPVALASVSGAPVTSWTGVDVAAKIAPTPSGSELRITIVLYPSSDGTMTPTLDAWRQAFVCVATE